LLFSTLIKNIRKYGEIQEKERDVEYTLAIMSFLSIALGKHIDRNCRAISWDSSREIIGHALASRGIPMMWNHAEVNPFVKGSGTLLKVNKSILEGLRYSIERLENRGKVAITNNSVTQLNFKSDLIICDPPYFDDIRYAEFSEFFYSWEEKILKNYSFPESTPKSEEMSVGGWGRNKEFFNKLFYLSNKRIYENLSENGLLVMFFAHSSVDAWDFAINSLQKSGFRITATWPVHTENPISPV